MSYDKPISYSGRKLFKQCPRKWYVTYVEKDREAPGVAAQRGTDIHDQLEQFFRGGVAYPNTKVLAPWRRFMEGLTLYDPVPEGDLAVDVEWNPCGFDDEHAYYRGKADLVYQEGDTLVILDWKTGKIYPDHEDQGKTYMALHDECSKVRTGFVYIDQPLTVHWRDYTAEHRTQEIEVIRSDIELIRNATEFPATPNSMGCRWCKQSWRNGGTCEAAP